MNTWLLPPSLEFDIFGIAETRFIVHRIHILFVESRSALVRVVHIGDVVLWFHFLILFFSRNGIDSCLTKKLSIPFLKGNIEKPSSHVKKIQLNTSRFCSRYFNTWLDLFNTAKSQQENSIASLWRAPWFGFPPCSTIILKSLTIFHFIVWQSKNHQSYFYLGCWELINQSNHLLSQSLCRFAPILRDSGVVKKWEFWLLPMEVSEI